jgi:hypothetical protein
MPKSRLQVLLVLAWLHCQSVSAEEFIQPLLPMAEVDVLAAPTTHFPIPVQDMNCASIEMEQKSYAASGGSRLSMNELAQTYRDVSGKNLAPLDVAKYAAKMIPGALGSSRMSQCSDLTGDQAMAILALNEIKAPSLPPPQLGNDKPAVIRTAGLLPAVLPAAGQLVGNVVGTSVNLVTSVTNILPVVTGSLLGN